MTALDDEIAALHVPLPKKDDSRRDDKLLAEYAQRMTYQSHLIDRQWKVLTIYLIVYGFLFAAIRSDGSDAVDLLVVSGVNWVLGLIVLITLVNQRRRRVLNAARLKIVASDLDLVGITHYSKKIHSVLNLRTESFWVFLFIALSPALTSIYALLKMP